MRRSVMLAAALMGGLVASNSMAALVITQTRGTSTAAPGYDVIYYTVKDDASTTTALQAQSFTFTATGGKFVFPDGDEFGGVGTGQSAAAIAGRSTPTGSFAFLPSATNIATPGADSTTVDFSSPQTNWSAQSFRTASAYTTTAAGGLIVAAAVVTPGTVVNATGSVASVLDTAQAVTFNLTSGTTTGPVNVAPVVTSPAPQTVTFGQTVSAGKSFTSTVTATDDAAQTLALAVGTLPAGVSNVQVTSTSSAGTTTFTVTGLLNFSTNKTTVTIPFTVSDNGTPSLSSTGNIVLNVVPEPTTLAALAGAAGLGLIRRRK